MLNTLFDTTPEPNNSEREDAVIINTVLYYSMAETQEFKRLSKVLLKHLHGADFREGNISDMVLYLLRKEYERIQSSQKND